MNQGAPSHFYSLVSIGWSLIKDDLRLTLAAQVFTIPIIFFTFRQISLIAPLTNILIAWTIPLIMSIGFLLVFFGLLWVPLGAPLAWVSWVLLEYLVIVVDLTAKLSFASFRW